jgi:tyrosyl-tRNA synthetase
MSQDGLAPLISCLQDRGFLHQCTDLAGLDQAMQTKPIVAYIGFDATSDSLHVGSLVQIMLLRWLQKFGHKPIILLGGGTTKIGDPSGKDTARKMLTEQDISANMAGIRSVFSQFLTIGDGPSDAVVVNNADWLDQLGYISFLRDVGAHFSINRMLTFDSVKSRLDREQPLSFLEFNYMILQAYDFIELHKRYGCSLQLGGSDQWGNIVSGIDLGRRVLQAPLYGWTAPLLTTASGAKMGKTAQGAVWLSEHKLPVYDFWQFWRNVDDQDVAKFLKLFTELPLEDIDAMTAVQGQALNEAKVCLADAVTAMCHGHDKAQAAKKTAADTFAQSGLGADLPTVTLSHADLAEGVALTKLMVDCGFAPSNSAARRLIQGGGVRLGDAKITEIDQMVTQADFDQASELKLAVGKKRFARIARGDCQD